MNQATEKRRHDRVPVRVSLDIKTGSGVKKCRGTIADLSASGMTFESDALLEKGQSIRLKSDIPLEIRGEVRNIKPAEGGGLNRYGIRFHFISAPSARPSVN